VLQRTLIQAALSRSELTTLLVTFGLSIVIENGLLQFFTANSRGLGVGDSLHHRLLLDRLADHHRPGSLVIFVLAVVVLLGLQYFLSGPSTAG
jgi:branched-chain amino acid transport system permease protein